MPLNHGIVHKKSIPHKRIPPKTTQRVNEPTRIQIQTQTQSHLLRIRVSLTVVLLWLLLVT